MISRKFNYILSGYQHKAAFINYINVSDSLVDSSASMVESFRPNEKIERIINIPAFDFDCLELKLDNISILKIDIEGGELEVIKSALNIIDKYKPIILMEILPVYNAQNTLRIKRQNEMLAILFDKGYQLYRILKQNDTLKGFKLLHTIEIHSDINLCEYIFVHNFDTAKFEANVLKNQFELIK